MGTSFAEALKRLRIERGLSQAQLAGQVYVDRSTIARWENGSRLPDAAMISRLTQCLGVDANTLLNAVEESDDTLNVIMVEDRKVILTDALSVLAEVLPEATVTGFTYPSEAVEFARDNRVSLAFLDIELGRVSGFDLCRELLEVYPLTNVVYVTAYPDYALDAWATGACGYMLKPITAEGVRTQLRNLRHPLASGGAGE